MATSSRTRARVQINRKSTNIILNSALDGEFSINDLYGDSVIQNGKEDHHKDFKSGLKVTVLIPPVSMYNKVPNFANISPYITKAEADKVHKKIQAYRKAVAPAKVKLASKKRQLRDILAITPRGNVQKKQISALTEEIAAIEKSLGAGAGGLLAKYSSRYDITDFVTTLNWSSAENQGTIELSLTLDNIGGIFNYLPVGAKVTVWRKKSLKNWTPGSTFNQRWHPYLQTYIAEKTREANGRDHKISISCWDRFAYTGKNDLPIKEYKEDSTHPKGWSPREITLDVCKRAGIPVDPARIPEYIIQPGTQGTPNGLKWPRLPKFKASDTNIAQTLADAWNDSLLKVGHKNRRPYLLHMRRGNLEVEIVSPPGQWVKGYDFNTERRIVHYSDEAGIQSATLGEKITNDTWTVLKATGKIVSHPINPRTGKKEKKIKKVTGTFKANDIILQAFGERAAIRNFTPEFKSFADFEKYCKNWIEIIARPEQTLEMEGKGVLGMWPLRYVYVDSRYLGIRGYFMIKTISYEIVSGTINVRMTLDVKTKVYTDGYEYYSKRPVKPTDLDKWY